jgi:hypothetical protein
LCRSEYNSIEDLFWVVNLIIQVGSGALIPLEVCIVPPGQIMRKQIPPEKTKEVLEFATRKPQDRLTSIKAGLQVGFCLSNPLQTII